MAKDTFQRTKPHCNVGTIGHIDHVKTTLTASLLAVQAAKGLATFKSYADIAEAGTVRDDTKPVTIAVSPRSFSQRNSRRNSARRIAWLGSPAKSASSVSSPPLE